MMTSRVPPQNIVATCDEIRTSGAYPIRCRAWG